MASPLRHCVWAQPLCTPALSLSCPPLPEVCRPRGLGVGPPLGPVSGQEAPPWWPAAVPAPRATSPCQVAGSGRLVARGPGTGKRVRACSAETSCRGHVVPWARHSEAPWLREGSGGLAPLGRGGDQEQARLRRRLRDPSETIGTGSRSHSRWRETPSAGGKRRRCLDASEAESA